MREERKLVSVLFADVVGSTALGDVSDPEVVRARMGRYFDQVSRIAEAHGGTVEKFAGDAVMVVFGVPTAHDDDAERAVRAALQIRDEVTDVTVRVGVNSGEAVTSAREDRQFLVSGDAVNVAARLQQAAEPGQVLVGELTEQLTRRAIDYRPVEPVPAKGKPEPVGAHLALAARSALPVQARGLPELRAPLIGRHRELGLILDTFSRSVEDRRPHLFTIIGSPGIGKSRLVAEAISASAVTGAAILRGRCLPYGRGITYWPLFEVLQADVGLGLSDANRQDKLEAKLNALGAPAEDRGPLRARLAVILGLQTPQEAMPDIPMERVSRELAWAFRRYLQLLAAGRPVLLVIDDLQWAEDALVEIIEHVVDRLADLPVMVICIARPELAERRPGWSSGKPDATTLTLDPLRPTEVAALVSALLDVDSLPEELRRRIVDRAEGTPLFAEEVVGMLIADGRLVNEGGAWRAAADVAEVEVPRSIQAVLTARLDALLPSEKSLLQAASVVGERFRPAEVAEMVPDAYEAIDSALRKGLLAEEESTGETRFRHLLIRDAAYASIPKRQRADLHERFARKLENEAADPRQVAEILVHHWDRSFALSQELHLEAEAVAERAQQALRWALEMGERAQDRGDVVALGAALEIAREAAAVTGESETARLLLQEAMFHTIREEVAAAQQAVAAAAAAAERTGSRQLVARVRVTEATIIARLGEPDEIKAVTTPAIEACRQAGDARGELICRAALAIGHWGAGELADFVELQKQIADSARKMGDQPLEASALDWLSRAEFFRGNVATAQSAMTAAAELSEAFGLRETRLRVEQTRGHLAMLRRELEAAEDHYRRMLSEGEEVGLTGIVLSSLRFLGYLDQFRPDPRAMVRHVDRAISISESTGDRWHRSELYGLRARAALLLGDINAAESFIERCLEFLRPLDVTANAEAYEHLAAIRAAQGRPMEAEAAHRRAIAAITATEFNWPISTTKLAYAEFLARQGRFDEARPLLEERQAWLHERGWHLFDPIIERTRDLLARV